MCHENIHEAHFWRAQAQLGACCHTCIKTPTTKVRCLFCYKKRIVWGRLYYQKWCNINRRALICWQHGPLTRHVKLWVAYALGTPGMFSPPPNASWRSRQASRHERHARAVLHVEVAKPRWRGKYFRHSRCTRNPQFYVNAGLTCYSLSKLQQMNRISVML